MKTISDLNSNWYGVFEIQHENVYSMSCIFKWPLHIGYSSLFQIYWLNRFVSIASFHFDRILTFPVKQIQSLPCRWNTTVGEIKLNALLFFNNISKMWPLTTFQSNFVFWILLETIWTYVSWPIWCSNVSHIIRHHIFIMVYSSERNPSLVFGGWTSESFLKRKIEPK